MQISSKNLIFTTAMVLVVANPRILCGATSPAKILDETQKKLESETWSASDEQLNDLENKIARRIQENPYDQHAFYLLVHVQLRRFSASPDGLASLKTASELSQHTIDLDPTTDLGYLALAETLDIMGQTEDALAVLDRVKHQDIPLSWRFPFTMARLSTQKFDSSRVFELLEHALSMEGSDYEIVVPYVVAMLATSYDSKQLLDQLFEWDRKFPHRLFKEQIAAVFVENGEYTKAHQIYLSIYDQKEPHVDAMINDAILLYRFLNQPENANRLFARVLESKISMQSHFVAEMRSMIHGHYGASLMKAGSTQLGEHELLRAVQTAPDQSVALEFVARIFSEQKSVKRSSDFYSRLIENTHPQGMLYALLAEALAQENKNGEAIIAYENALILEPNRSEYMVGKGLVYFRDEKLKQALDDFNEAFEMDPNNAAARYNAACALSRLNRPQEAVAALGEAIMIDPSLAQSAKDDEDFAALRTRQEFQNLLNGVEVAH